MRLLTTRLYLIDFEIIVKMAYIIYVNLSERLNYSKDEFCDKTTF